MAEHWRLKPEALGSIPGGATFPSKPLPFQRSTDGGGPIVSFIDTIGLRTTEESCPSDSSTAVITLSNFSHQGDHAHFFSFILAKQKQLVVFLFLVVSHFCHYPTEKRLDHAYKPYCSQ